MRLNLTLLPLPLLPLTSAFTLNTKTPYWSYTTTSLANTTSEECKAAYSAEITCHPYLLALVNANEMRSYLPSMQKSNFTATCTKTCHDSLAQYIQKVESTCSSPEDGDAALKGVGVWGGMEFQNVPVVTVGRVLEYTLMSACAVDEKGENCYISQSSIIPSKFSCSWGCAVAYWYNRHEYPYSEWQFGDTSGRNVEIDKDGKAREVNSMNAVLVQHSVFGDQMEGAWRVVEGCMARNSSFKTGIEGVAVGVKVGSGMNSTNGSNDTSSAPVQSGPVDGGAVGIRAGWTIIMATVSSLVYLL